MRAIKKINNNAAICIDDNNCELVAIGTGIGFPECPYEIKNLNVIQRTFYDVDIKYYHLLTVIPEEIIETTIQIVDEFRNKSQVSISSNIVFTLADHIHFAIERTKKNIQISTPMMYDIQHLYTFEYEIGLYALKIIKKRLKIRLPKGEAANIALHFINAETVSDNLQSHGYIDSIIVDITEIVSKTFNIYIDKESYNYSRFVTHIQYLLQRIKSNQHVLTENMKMLKMIKSQYELSYDCALKIRDYLIEEMNFNLNEEECLYLILHINRLCASKDIENQK